MLTTALLLMVHILGLILRYSHEIFFNVVLIDLNLWLVELGETDYSVSSPMAIHISQKSACCEI